MTKTEIREELVKLIDNEMPYDKSMIRDEMTLEDLGLDSLNKVSLTYMMEGRFHINEIEDDDVSLDSTVEELVELIFKYKN